MKVDNLPIANQLRMLAEKISDMADDLEAPKGAHISRGTPETGLTKSRKKPSESVLFRFSEQLLAEEAARLFSQRRLRSSFLPDLLLGEPCWDILLELFYDQRTGRRSTVSSACRAANVPFTTALRWLNTLEANGLIKCATDTIDRRVRNVSLTKDGEERMRAILNGTINSRGANSDAKQSDSYLFRNVGL